MLEQIVLVLGWKGYSFTDGNNKQVEGANVQFIQKNPSSEQLKKGHLVMSSKISLEDAHKTLSVVPGLYKAKMELVEGKGGKASLEVVGFDFMNDYQFDFGD